MADSPLRVTSCFRERKGLCSTDLEKESISRIFDPCDKWPPWDVWWWGEHWNLRNTAVFSPFPEHFPSWRGLHPKSSEICQESSLHNRLRGFLLISWSQEVTQSGQLNRCPNWTWLLQREKPLSNMGWRGRESWSQIPAPTLTNLRSLQELSQLQVSDLEHTDWPSPGLREMLLPLRAIDSRMEPPTCSTSHPRQARHSAAEDPRLTGKLSPSRFVPEPVPYSAYDCSSNIFSICFLIIKMMLKHCRKSEKHAKVNTKWITGKYNMQWQTLSILAAFLPICARVGMQVFCKVTILLTIDIAPGSILSLTWWTFLRSLNSLRRHIFNGCQIFCSMEVPQRVYPCPYYWTLRLSLTFRYCK